MSLLPRIGAKVVRDQIGPYADKEALLNERIAIYGELIGFVPPRIEARMAVTGALDPTLPGMQETMREQARYPKCFDTQTVQLMLFGMLPMDMSDAAQLHAIAVRRAGASGEEMQAVIRPVRRSRQARGGRPCV